MISIHISEIENPPKKLLKYLSDDGYILYNELVIDNQTTLLTIIQPIIDTKLYADMKS